MFLAPYTHMYIHRYVCPLTHPYTDIRPPKNKKEMEVVQAQVKCVFCSQSQEASPRG